MSERQSQNRTTFLTTPIHRLFIKQTLPMLLVMLTSGLLNIIDAMFLGHYVGSDALAAVSLIFPIIMLTIALSTLVSGGMSSLLTRLLGAKKYEHASALFTHAHGLALCIALVLISVYLLFGNHAIDYMVAGSKGSSTLSVMADTYLWIMIMALPIQFGIGIHADTWRHEGYVGLIAGLSVGVTLANIAFNYLFIAELGLAVAGSAYGTVLAQTLGLGWLMLIRANKIGLIPISSLWEQSWFKSQFSRWRDILFLGAPLSLSFIGIALVSTTVLSTLSMTNIENYTDTVAAYGVVTRILGFTFMPLMAIALATQSIVGNNIGASLLARSDATLRLALMASFICCLFIECSLFISSDLVGRLFITDISVVSKISTILNPMIYGYISVGPILVLAMYFQTIGRPLHAAMLTLLKPFVFSPVLIILFAYCFGGKNTWFAFTVADGLIIAMTLIVVMKTRSNRSHGFGVKPIGLK